MNNKPVIRPLKAPMGLYDPLFEDKSLELLYFFNGSDPTGVVIDQSGKKNHGTINGALYRGNSLLMDGDDNLSLLLDLSHTDKLTFITLVKPTGSGFRCIASMGDASQYWALYINPTGFLACELKGNVGTNSRNGLNAYKLSNDCLHTVGVQLDISNPAANEIFDIFVNGDSRAAAENASNNNTGNFAFSTLRLGEYIAATNWIGSFYFTCIFSKILAKHEIKRLHNIAMKLI